MKSPRKTRKQERRSFVVQWVEEYTLYFRWYKRDTPAINFQNWLIETQGVHPEDVRIVMK